MHGKMLQLISSCLENLGPAFVNNPSITPLIEPTIDFLLQYLVKTVIKSSKKAILKNIKYIFMLVSGFANLSEEHAELAQILLS